MRKKILTLLPVLVGLAAFRLLAQNAKELQGQISSEEVKLEKLHSRIQNLRSREKDLKENERALLIELDQLKIRLQRAQKKRKALLALEQKTEAEKEAARKKAADLSVQEQSLRQRMQEVLRLVSRLNVGNSPVRAAEIKTLVHSVFELRQGQLHSTVQHKSEALERTAELEKKKVDLASQGLQLEKQAQAQESLRQKKQQLFEQTKNDRSQISQEARQLEENSKALGALISSLEHQRKNLEAKAHSASQEKKSAHPSSSPQKTKASSAGFARGQFLAPAYGAVVEKFGRSKHPELGILVVHNGIKVRTQPGADIAAAQDGAVVFAAPFRSYGLTVILDHGNDQYSIYGLLNEIVVKKGDSVKKQNILGRVAKKSPIFYFELRVQGEAQNPLEWLKK